MTSPCGLLLRGFITDPSPWAYGKWKAAHSPGEYCKVTRDLFCTWLVGWFYVFLTPSSTPTPRAGCGVTVIALRPTFHKGLSYGITLGLFSPLSTWAPCLPRSRSWSQVWLPVVVIRPFRKRDPPCLQMEVKAHTADMMDAADTLIIVLLG